MRVCVCGLGPGDERYLTREVRDRLAGADRILTSLKDRDFLGDKAHYLPLSEMLSFLRVHRDADMDVVVAASGDTGFYSIASTIRRTFPDQDITFLPGVSSLSLLAARTGLGYEDARLISLHGRAGDPVPYVTYNEKVFMLTGGEQGVEAIISRLTSTGLRRKVTLYIGEKLGLPGEKITVGRVSELEGLSFQEPVSLLACNEDPTDPFRHFRDEDFIRGKAPMTKETVRDLVVSQLAPQPTDTIYDIGAGTGAVSCAIAQRLREGILYAIEKEADRVRLIRENIEETGSYNIEVREGEAPEGMDDLPAPDRVFIGGSSGNMAAIVDSCLSKNADAVFVVTAISLETLEEARELFAQRNRETDICCVNAAKARKLGSYHLMQAENPVYIIRA